MLIFVGADYRGINKKRALLKFLAGKGYEVVDKGAYIYREGDDYNDPAVAVSESVREEWDGVGILICDSAHGMTMQANRYKGIRAAHCDSIESAQLAREHDDANVLCLSARFLSTKQMYDIVQAFLETDFVELERRNRRINRLDEREDYD